VAHTQKRPGTGPAAEGANYPRGPDTTGYPPAVPLHGTFTLRLKPRTTVRSELRPTPGESGIHPARETDSGLRVSQSAVPA